ncbi:MAG TPA: EAL domain-containing response regulator [Polyangiaceae bacterium]|nr:EAL domain-containing response regulator [Polyangiaceae bacterium]
MTKRPNEVLLVDDDQAVRKMMQKVLVKAGLNVHAVEKASEALEILKRGRRFEAIVTDLMMPEMDGMQLLRFVRQLDLDVPMIIVTGKPTLESAIMAMEYGGFRYLPKPVENQRLVEVVREAAMQHRVSLLKRKALEICEAGGWLLQDLDQLEERFEQALSRLWIAYQPIVVWPAERVYGYEALVRSFDPDLPRPGMLFDAAERLGRVQDLGQRIRDAVAESAASAPSDALIFTNLHALDLSNDLLYSSGSALAGIANRVVLEVTERASLHRIHDLKDRMRTLRDLGYRIAVDDLGAGYSGLSSFAQLEPDVAKLDMSLIRDVDGSSSKASLVKSMISVCTQDLGIKVVCEGVETVGERDTLARVGAELYQGYLFAKPENAFRKASIFAPALS